MLKGFKKHHSFQLIFAILFIENYGFAQPYAKPNEPRSYYEAIRNNPKMSASERSALKMKFYDAPKIKEAHARSAKIKAANQEATETAARMSKEEENNAAKKGSLTPNSATARPTRPTAAPAFQSPQPSRPSGVNSQMTPGQVGVSDMSDELVFPDADDQPTKRKRPRRTPPGKRH